MKRITISLDDGLYRIAKAYAQSEDISLSKAVVRLMRRGIEGGHQNDPTVAEESPPFYYTDPRTGLRVMSIGRKVTMEEVAQVIDDDDLRHLEHLVKPETEQ